MFEPGLTKGVLEAFVSPAHHSHFSADDQSTKAIEIQNACLHGKQSPEFKHLTAAEWLMLCCFFLKIKVEKIFWLDIVVIIVENQTVVGFGLLKQETYLHEVLYL